MFTHNLNPVLFDLGIIAIRWYSLAYVFGIIIGWWYGKKIIKKLVVDNKISILRQFDELITYLIISIINMATRKYKSKKHLSKKHGKKSKNHKKHAKKTRKYRKKRGGDKSPLQYKYFPQYEEIIETLDKIGAGNESVDTVVPGQFSDKDTTTKPSAMLEKYLDMKNTVSCVRRAVIGDKQNCDKQKRRLYNKIITKCLCYKL